MKALHNLQRAFAADLWGDDLHHLQGLVLDDHLPAARRFNVYRNNFQSSLTDALAAIYPVTEQLVGRDFFRYMADQYTRAHPSRSGDIHEFGRAMPRFLSRLQTVSSLPYLADVSRLEWDYHTVFHAADPPRFEPSSLQQFAAEDWPKLRLCMGPACRLIHSMYPIFRIWKVNQERFVGDKNVSLDMGPDSVLVVRPKLDVELWRLNPAESTFLECLVSRNVLGEAVEKCLAHSSDFDLQSVLQRCLSAGALMVVES